jgi:hypothetical protein
MVSQILFARTTNCNFFDFAASEPVLSSAGRGRKRMKSEIASDYRVKELLVALKEGILNEEFVKARLVEWVGEDVDLIHYSDGEYGIISGEF